MADFGIAYFPDAKVAHAYLGKDARAGIPTLAIDDLVQELKAELVELVTEQQIEYEQLTDTVADEGELNEEIEHHQVVSEKLARYAAYAGQKALEQQQTAACLFAPPRVVHVLIDCREHVRHVLLTALILVYRFVVRRRLDNVAHVYA